MKFGNEIYQAKYWQAGKECGISKHEPSIIDRNSDIMKRQCEEHLNKRDDESSMNNELSQIRRALVGQPAVP